ncbi:hypothetical protein Cni_G20027 [Canna indica]|uniref:Uncharacterized protein n=1 Tax=Canna indica TaxID=4628 RepID=A0AAQ3QKB9_9LILI|nr:hypothetical protein Cni_G20027 [Canna indica]
MIIAHLFAYIFSLEPGNSHLPMEGQNLSSNSGNHREKDNYIWVAPKLKRDMIRVDWSPEESSILEDEMSKCASVERLVDHFANVVSRLQGLKHDASQYKGICDVALRYRWMMGRTSNNKENCEEGKDENNLSKNGGDRKDAKPATTNNAPPCDAINDQMWMLLQQNLVALKLISENIDNSKLEDNIMLFLQTRENILTILEELRRRKLPPLGIEIDEDLTRLVIAGMHMPYS